MPLIPASNLRSKTPERQNQIDVNKNKNLIPKIKFLFSANVALRYNENQIYFHV